MSFGVPRAFGGWSNDPRRPVGLLSDKTETLSNAQRTERSRVCATGKARHQSSRNVRSDEPTPIQQRFHFHAIRVSDTRDCAMCTNAISPLGPYSIADIHLFRLYRRFFNSLQPAAGEFLNLDAHCARMITRP